jgi:hypothetical protein
MIELDAFTGPRRRTHRGFGGLLRHASMKVTADVYMQAVSPQKREAQTELARMVLKNGFSGLSGPYWTMTETGGIAEVLWNVGVPGGIRTRVTAVKGGPLADHVVNARQRSLTNAL